jgi:thiol-disulfide isomerase/thioredoxin
VSRTFHLCLLAFFASWLGCEQAPKPTPEPSPTTATGKVEILAAAPGDDAALVIQRAAEQARLEDRQLVVYVGATWCEPCERFHKAALAGELDTTFPKLRLLEFDRDRDEARLGRAGCLSRLIPLFAKPDATGRCSDARIEGGIKGEGAVAEITPRLSQLLR